MTTYAVGDIQGCYSILRELLDSLDFDETKDRLWVAGDTINRGPESLATLRYLRQLGKRCTVVLGNHDLHFLAVALGVRDSRRGDTLDALLAAPDRDELVDWLRQRPLVHLSRKKACLMVHAGVPPQWDEETILARARELEAVIRSPDAPDFFRDLYSDTKGNRHLNTTADYFTRMRFCTANGELEFAHKKRSPPPGFAPWFVHEHRRREPLTVLFGHWAALRGKTRQPGYEALDTGCVWGGQLTALRLKDRKRFCVDGHVSSCLD